MTTGIWILLLWNAVVFCIYGADKQKARAGAWRTRESTLLLCAFLLGGAGAFLGMRAFRHKTRRPKFRILLPLSLIANATALYFLWPYLS